MRAKRGRDKAHAADRSSDAACAKLRLPGQKLSFWYAIALERSKAVSLFQGPLIAPPGQDEVVFHVEHTPIEITTTLLGATRNQARASPARSKPRRIRRTSCPSATLAPSIRASQRAPWRPRPIRRDTAVGMTQLGKDRKLRPHHVAARPRAPHCETSVACDSRNAASSTLVLPAPLGPTNIDTPGVKATLTSSRQRKPRIRRCFQPHLSRLPHARTPECLSTAPALHCLSQSCSTADAIDIRAAAA